MWRAVICLCAALMLGVPQLAHAQFSGDDRQNPTEYTNDDSHPLRMIAYLLAPVGFVLEWGVARPMHYVATDTFLAPVFSGEVGEPAFTPPAIAEIPLDNVGEETGALPPTEVTPAPAGAAPQVQPKALRPGGQPVLH